MVIRYEKSRELVERVTRVIHHHAGVFVAKAIQQAEPADAAFMLRLLQTPYDNLSYMEQSEFRVPARKCIAAMAWDDGDWIVVQEERWEDLCKKAGEDPKVTASEKA
jgi:hypothetical protein